MTRSRRALGATVRTLNKCDEGRAVGGEIFKSRGVVDLYF